MFSFLITATIAQRKKKNDVKLATNDYVSAKEFIKGKIQYKMNKADETLAAWKTAHDADNKKLEYNVENAGDLLLTCPTGFAPCNGFQGESAVYKHEHACCALDVVERSEKCPLSSHFYEDKCWVPAKYAHSCPTGYESKSEKCIKHLTAKPDELCPSGYEQVKNFQDGEVHCESTQEVKETICDYPAIRDGDQCVEEVAEKPRCPAGYDLVLSQYGQNICRREYTASCDMHVPDSHKPNLRKLGMVEDYYKHMEHEKKHAAKVTIANEKANEKAMAKDFHYAEKALQAMPKHEKEQYNKLLSKVVKATCRYEEFAQVIQDYSRQIVESRVETRIEVSRAQSVTICPVGYALNSLKGECILFKEKPMRKQCTGIVVLGKCMQTVPTEKYCEAPWVSRSIDNGRDIECIRTVFAPGLYTWSRDHTCFGNAKYCTALNRYIDGKH